MKRLVLDASVCLKWFLIGGDEQDVEAAQTMRSRVQDGAVSLIEPPVWHSEIAAVFARKEPGLAARMIAGLMRVEARIEADAQCMQRAVELSIQLDHHLFDTIYHAIAIEHGIDLVTADEHYYRKARKVGHIVLLRDWRPPRAVAERPAKHIVRARKPAARGRRKRR